MMPSTTTNTTTSHNDTIHKKVCLFNLSKPLKTQNIDIDASLLKNSQGKLDFAFDLDDSTISQVRSNNILGT
jgi:hypothetical protein